MNTIQGTHQRKPRGLRTLVWSAFLLGSLAVASCGGGGGGGSAAVSAVQVSTVAPAQGPFIGGTPVTIRGVNFKLDGSNVVKVGGNTCTDVAVVDSSTITCKTPAGTPGAVVDVVVSNAEGQGRLAGGFSYLTPAPATSDVNGDGIADLIVAAPNDDAAGPDSGAVYVFLGADGPSTFLSRTAAEADVRLIGHHSNDGFGSCVCAGDLNGDDVDDLVVGAALVDAVGAADAGACYVFFGPLGASSTLSALTADVKLSGQTSVAGDRFGSALEVADLTGDGRADVVVGAANHDIGSVVDAGCVYLFRGGATLSSRSADQADFFFDGVGQNDRLGNQITCGDLDGDGTAELVICAQHADVYLPPILQNGGRIFVVRGGATMVSTAVGQSTAIFQGIAENDQFGASAAIGDVNDDGIDDLVAGAPLNDAFDADAGRVYVFLGSATLAGRWADQADVILSGLPTHNSFGRAVRVGDIDGDAVADILVGAPNADYLNDGNGRAYLFRGGSGLASQVAIQAAAIFNGENQQGDAFASTVSLLDLNGDGFAEVSCGSTLHAGGAGRVYLWKGGNGTLLGQHLASNADVLFSGVQAGSQFGSGIAEGQ
jgi:hypothetical protein